MDACLAHVPAAALPFSEADNALCKSVSCKWCLDLPSLPPKLSAFPELVVSGHAALKSPGVQSPLRRSCDSCFILFLRSILYSAAVLTQ